MTANTITVRLRRPKAELQSRAKPNLNSWINDLIDQALGPKDPNWVEHFERKKSQTPVRFRSDEVRAQDR